MDRVQLTKYESTALGGQDADALPFPAPLDPQEDAIETAGVYLQDASNRDETVLLSRSGDDMTFKDVNNSGGLTLSQLVRSVSKVGTPANNELAVWTGDGTIEGESDLTYDGSTLSVSAVLSATKVAVAGPIRITEVASPDGDEAGKGQIWCKDNTPNDLYFRDDTGVDHLLSLTETDYAKLTGRAGGQTLQGGTEASQDLTLVSTASATRGYIYLGAVQTSAFDETNERLGIGIATPDQTLHVHKSSAGTIDANSKSWLVIEAADHAYINFLSSAGKEQGIIFGEAGDSNTVGGIFYYHPTDELYFSVDGNTVFNVDSSGNVTLQQTGSTLAVGGNITADSTLHVWAGSAGAVSPLAGTQVTIEDNATAYLSFLTPNTATSGILFGDPEDNDVGQITYSHSANQLSFTDGTTGTKTLAELAASSGAQISGTPADNQVAVWTNATTIEGASLLVYDGSALMVGVSSTFGDAVGHFKGSNYPVLYIESSDANGGDVCWVSSTGSYQAYIQGADLRWYDSADRITFKAGGNVGIGETSPLAKLHVKNTDTGIASVAANYSNVVIEDSTNYAGITILSDADHIGGLVMTDVAATYRGFVVYDHGSANTDALYLGTAGTTRVTIDSSGNTGIGRTPSFKLDVAGNVQIGTDPYIQIPGYANQIEFTRAGANYFISETTGGYFVFRTNNNSGTDMTMNTSGDLQLSGNLTVSSTLPTIWIYDESAGDSALSRTMPGLQLSNLGSNPTNKYTPAIKFMSTDANFTTENPKFLAAIVGRDTEGYYADTDGGMAIDFAVTDENPGATSVPSVAMTLDHTGYLGLKTTSPEADLHMTTAISGTSVWWLEGWAADSAISRTMSGLQLSAGTVAPTSYVYTPAIKFMSTDSNFTTENPKLLAAIAGRGTESYAADTDGGMAIDFFATDDDPGTTNVPDRVMSIEATHVWLDQIPLSFESTGTTQVYKDGGGNLTFKDFPTGTKTLAQLAAGSGAQISGTPVDNQVAVWTNSTTIEGDANLTWDGTELLVKHSTAPATVRLAPTSTNAAQSAIVYLLEGDQNYGGFIRYDGAENNLNIGMRSAATDYDAVHIARETRYVGISAVNMTPEGLLHVKTGDSGATPTVQGDELILESNGTQVGMQILGGTDNVGAVFFGDPASAIVGGVKYDHSSDKMLLRLATADKFGFAAVSGSLYGLGINETSPMAYVHVFKQSTGVSSLSAAYDGFCVEGTGPTGITILSGTGSVGAIAFGDADDADIGIIGYDHSANTMTFTTKANETMRLDNGGNVLIGATVSPTANGGRVLVFGDNGANPTPGTATAAMFAKTVSTVVEMFAVDSAGNASQISPHDPETGEWIYYSKNIRTGVVKKVNMEKLVALVEELSGEKLMQEWVEDCA